MRAFSQDISPREAAVHIYLEQQKCSVHTPASRNKEKPSPPRAPSPIPPIAPASSPGSPTLVSYTAVNCPSRATKLLYTRLTRIWLPRQHREAAQPATTPRHSSAHGTASQPLSSRQRHATAHPTATPPGRLTHGNATRQLSPRHCLATAQLAARSFGRSIHGTAARPFASSAMPLTDKICHTDPSGKPLTCQSLEPPATRRPFRRISGRPRKPTRTRRVEIAPSKCRPSVPASGATCMPPLEILQSPTHQQSHGTPPAIASAPTRAAK